MFLSKYGTLSLYDEYQKKISTNDHEQLEFNKNYGWNLIGTPEKSDGNFSDHEYFCIHDDLFGRIQSNNQDRNIICKFISNEPNENESQSEATEIHDDRIQNKKRITEKYIQPSILFRERGKES